MTVYMYAYNVLLTNTCNMYEIKILLLLLLLLLLLCLYEFTCKFTVSLSGNHHFIIQALLVFIFYVSSTLL